MKKQIELVKSIRCSMLLAILSLILLAGCAGPRVADDLLVKTEQLNSPLVDNGYSITTEINPRINNYEKIDNSVEESLDIALKRANIFSDNPSQPYIINANVEIASQAAMSFGSFEGKLQVEYTVYDDNNKVILEKTIYTEAGSDEWFFSGAKRHSRARAVNIAKNVLEFTSYLKENLKNS